MSTTTSPQPALPSSVNDGRSQIKIVSHSMLFYWWPVWAVGLIMALYTFAERDRMAIVPPGTELGHIGKATTVEFENDRAERIEKKIENRTVLVLPERATAEPPHLLMSKSKNLGVLFAIVLLLVTVITSVPLRGLWSVIIIVLIALLTVIFAWMEWWSHVLDYLSALQIHINGGGYLFIALALFLAWLVTMLFFDRQIYMIFTPGQLKVCLEIGGGETSYDTMGMVIQKQRDDLFRHWILGLGSGDLIVRTSGANAHEFHLPNVLFVGRKLQMIEDMQRERPIVRN